MTDVTARSRPDPPGSARGRGRRVSQPARQERAPLGPVGAPPRLRGLSRLRPRPAGISARHRLLCSRGRRARHARAFAGDRHRLGTDGARARGSGSPRRARRRRRRSDLPPSAIAFKERRKRHGREQHTKTGAAGSDFAIVEAGLRFIVNLEAYLDTGLFLDHRALRAIGARARGRPPDAEPLRLHGQLHRLRGRGRRNRHRYRRPVEHLSRLGGAQFRRQWHGCAAPHADPRRRARRGSTPRAPKDGATA